MANDSRPVYSTERGSLTSGPTAKAAPKPALRPGASSPGVRVGRETKGRKGAGVTVISGLNMTDAELKNLLSVCKKRLGCGGASKAGVLEFQGEHRDSLVTILAGLGIAAKKAGG